MTIFISIASYCDELLVPTLVDAFDKAGSPAELRFGVVDQDTVAARPAIDALAFRNQINYLHIDPQDARGLGWARHLAFSLYGGEDHLLQVDSHTVFEKGWDRSLIEQLQALQKVSSKPILTTYPPSFVLENGKPVTVPWEPGSIYPLRPAPDARISLGRPAFVYLAREELGSQPLAGGHVAGGFLSTLGSFVDEVPHDPFVYFFGEEHATTLRAFTRGWDIYTPIHVPLYHRYRDPADNSWRLHWDVEIDKRRAQSWSNFEERSADRLRELFFGRGLPGAYGRGQVRGLEDFRLLSGVDYQRMSISHDQPQSAGDAQNPLAADKHRTAVVATVEAMTVGARLLLLQFILQTQPPQLVIIVQHGGETSYAPLIADLRPAFAVVWLHVGYSVSQAEAYRIGLTHAVEAGATEMFLCDTADCFWGDYLAMGLAAMDTAAFAFAPADRQTLGAKTHFDPAPFAGTVDMPATLAGLAMRRPLAEALAEALAANPNRTLVEIWLEVVQGQAADARVKAAAPH